MSRVATPPKGQPMSQPMAPPASPMQVPMEKIAMRAYEKWCQRGCPHGTDQQDWYEAERELMAEYIRKPMTSQRR